MPFLLDCTKLNVENYALLQRFSTIGFRNIAQSKTLLIYHNVALHRIFHDFLIFVKNVR